MTSKQLIDKFLFNYEVIMFHLELTDILGWSSVVFCLLITIFNSMKITRFATFGSTANDLIWSALMGWWPKVTLNIAVTSVNLYRYAKDYTKAPLWLLNSLGLIMGIGISYVLYYSITIFLKQPSIAVAFQFLDLALILSAIYMKTIKNYRILMFLSGFVGFVGYYGNYPMMFIKVMVITIMIFKLFIEKEKTPVLSNQETQTT